MQPNIAILAGELSGDLVGGALARALEVLHPGLQLWGMGSRAMADAGVHLLHDSSTWAAIGVVEALKVYPELRLKVYPHLVREILARRPSVVVLIDFGAFNVKVARCCKEHGVPVLYYFPPGSWKRAGRLNPEIARITDRIATPFPWSADRLAGLGARVEFVGHPLLELARPTMTRAGFADRFGLDAGRPVVGLLPGSRTFELMHNTPALLGAAACIGREVPGTQFVLAPPQPVRSIAESIVAHFRAAASDKEQAGRHPAGQGAPPAVPWRAGPRQGKREPTLVTPEGVEVPASVLRREEDARGPRRPDWYCGPLPPLVIASGVTYDVMAHSDVLIVCSGTATLEAAVLGTPMVIMYRGSRLMWLEARVRRVRPEHIGMPNIIAGRRIVPEFVQNAATPEALAGQAVQLLRDGAARVEMRQELRAVRDRLGTPGASERTARMTLELAGLRRDDAGAAGDSATQAV